MKKSILFGILFTGILVSIAGILQSGWTSTTNPTTARTALNVPGLTNNNTFTTNNQFNGSVGIGTAASATPGSLTASNSAYIGTGTMANTNNFQVDTVRAAKAIEVGTNGVIYFATNIVSKGSSSFASGYAFGDGTIGLFAKTGNSDIMIKAGSGSTAVLRAAGGSGPTALSFAEGFNTATAIFSGVIYGKTAVITNTLTASDGVASFASNATNTVAATGVTNTYSVNAFVRITGTAVAVTVKSAAGATLDSYTLGTADTTSEILKPGEAITAASGLAGTMRPF